MMKQPAATIGLVMAFIGPGSFTGNAQDNGSNALFNSCEAVANNTISDPAQLYCTGFIRGIIPVLYKVHSFYEVSFPNLTYPITDQSVI